MSIHNHPSRRRGIEGASGDQLDGGGEPPHDGEMLKRIEKLEALAEKTVERLTVIERDVAVMKSNYATAADLHKELHATTWKIIGTVALLCATVFWMARNISPPPPPSAAAASTSIGQPASSTAANPVPK